MSAKTMGNVTVATTVAVVTMWSLNTSHSVQLEVKAPLRLLDGAATNLGPHGPGGKGVITEPLNN